MNNQAEMIQTVEALPGVPGDGLTLMRQFEHCLYELDICHRAMIEELLETRHDSLTLTRFLAQRSFESVTKLFELAEGFGRRLELAGEISARQPLFDDEYWAEKIRLVRSGQVPDRW